MRERERARESGLKAGEGHGGQSFLPSRAHNGVELLARKSCSQPHRRLIVDACGKSKLYATESKVQTAVSFPSFRLGDDDDDDVLAHLRAEERESSRSKRRKGGGLEQKSSQ